MIAAPRKPLWAHALLPAVSAAFLILGCANSKSSEPENEAISLAQAIVNGTPSPPEHDFVVLVHIEPPEGEATDCTGTLVSPRIVVTARHCVAPTQPGTFICRGNGELVHDGTGAGIFSDPVPASAVTIHIGESPGDNPAAYGMKVLTTHARDVCRDDFSIVELDRAVVAPIARLRWSGATRVGEEVTVAGYGFERDASSLKRRELRDQRILQVGATTPAEIDEHALTPPRTFVLGGRSVCFGDSGGPALSDASSALIGVYSRITGDCDALESRNTFMLASMFSELLTQAFADTSETPLLEADEVSTAAAGNAGSGTDPVSTGSAGNESTTTAVPPATASGGRGALTLDAAPQVNHDADVFKCSISYRRTADSVVPMVVMLSALFARSRLSRSRRRGLCEAARCRDAPGD